MWVIIIQILSVWRESRGILLISFISADTQRRDDKLWNSISQKKKNVYHTTTAFILSRWLNHNNQLWPLKEAPFIFCDSKNKGGTLNLYYFGHLAAAEQTIHTTFAHYHLKMILWTCQQTVASLNTQQTQSNNSNLPHFPQQLVANSACLLFLAGQVVYSEVYQRF